MEHLRQPCIKEAQANQCGRTRSDCRGGRDAYQLSVAQALCNHSPLVTRARAAQPGCSQTPPPETIDHIIQRDNQLLLFQL